MLFLTFFNGTKPILFPDISYAFYPVWAKLFGIPYEAIPLDEQLRIVPEDYCRPNNGIVFPNPNAPTGIALPLDAIRSILEHNPDSIVLVDEAYVDFGAESAVSLLFCRPALRKINLKPPAQAARATSDAPQL